MNTAPIPAHVPPALVADVDIYDLPGADVDPQLAWKAIDRPDGPGLVWSPRHGGHWIVTRGDLAIGIMGDLERFSAKELSVPRGILPLALIPNQSDNPEHDHYRRILLPFLLPKAVAALRDRVRALAIELIEGFLPRGRCDFVADFSKHLPMSIFLTLVDLPEKDRSWLVARADVMVRSGDASARLTALREMQNYLQAWIDKRGEKPGSDLLSAIVHGRVGERPMNAEEVMGEALDVMFGGLDTVASMMAGIMKHLATHPEHYQALVANPSSIPAAVEEMLRRYAVATVGRVALQDIKLDGVLVKADDMIITPTTMHSLDERLWSNPAEVDFSRPLGNGIGTFGVGGHKCPGERLARSEIIIMLEEWTRRIPAMRMENTPAHRGLSGAVIGMTELHLVWEN